MSAAQAGRHRRALPPGLALAAAWALAGCVVLAPIPPIPPIPPLPDVTIAASASVTSCPPGLKPMRSDSLYFGTTRADGRAVSDAEWDDFLAREVTPRFPDGLTVTAARGQWKGKDGRIAAERSQVLTIVHAGGDAQRQAFAAVITAYKARFEQESVLQVSTAACVAF